MATQDNCNAHPGDGWSRRAEDAILHGCIPVIIMDNVDEKFSTVVDYSKFSVRILEKDIPKVTTGVTPFVPKFSKHSDARMRSLCNFRMLHRPVCTHGLRTVHAMQQGFWSCPQTVCALQVPEILQGYTQSDIEELQRNLGKVWHRFMYANVPLLNSSVANNYSDNTRRSKENAKEGDRWESLPEPFSGDLRQDDAWNTIIEWLFGRMEDIQANDAW